MTHQYSSDYFKQCAVGVTSPPADFQQDKSLFSLSNSSGGSFQLPPSADVRPIPSRSAAADFTHLRDSEDAFLKRPSFRRQVSYVGRDEGFSMLLDDMGGDLYDLGDLALPSPVASNSMNYSFSPENPRRDHFFPTPLSSSDNTSSLNFDLAAVDGNYQLGAIPARTPRAVEEPMDTVDMDDGNEDDPELTERQIKIQRYRDKRSRRQYNKKVMYKCRQNFAQHRPRVHGRFVKLDSPEMAEYLAAQAARAAAAATPAPVSPPSTISSPFSSPNFKPNLTINLPTDEDTMDCDSDASDQFDFRLE